MACDDGLARFAVFAHNAHFQHMHQADMTSIVAIDIDLFGAPGLIGTLPLGIRLKACHFDEVEHHPVSACHGLYRAAVALKGRHIGLVQGLPGFTRRAIERHRRTAGGATTRRRRLAAQRPREGIARGWGGSLQRTEQHSAQRAQRGDKAQRFQAAIHRVNPSAIQADVSCSARCGSVWMNC